MVPKPRTHYARRAAPRIPRAHAATDTPPTPHHAPVHRRRVPLPQPKLPHRRPSRRRSIRTVVEGAVLNLQTDVDRNSGPRHTSGQFANGRDVCFLRRVGTETGDVSGDEAPRPPASSLAGLYDLPRPLSDFPG